jgi:hypothetical protein
MYLFSERHVAQPETPGRVTLIHSSVRAEALDHWSGNLHFLPVLRACGRRNLMKISSRYNPNTPERRGRYHSGQVEAVYLSDPERACLIPST